MKNHLTSSFDYSLLDVETSDFLYEKENILIGIQSRYSREVGKVFFEAQQKLSNKGNGTFEKWYSSIGFKKQNVNNYINIYKNVQSLDEPSAEIFDSLPKSLQNEMSKPSSNQELNQKVFDGDITTHKQYKELEKQLKQKDNQIQMQAKMIDDLSEQEPQVIEKEVVVEKIPDDYHDLKSSNMALLRELNSVSSDYQKSSQLISDINAENDKLKAEQEGLKRELNTKRQMENDELEQAQLKRLQRDADISVHKLILNMNEFVKEQAVTVYDSQAIAGASPDTKQKLDEGIKRVENLLKDIKQEIGGEVAWIIN